jgi:hypothetical protein
MAKGGRARRGVSGFKFLVFAERNEDITKGERIGTATWRSRSQKEEGAYLTADKRAGERKTER